VAERRERRISSYWMTLREWESTGNWRGSISSHSVENSLWTRVWTCRKSSIKWSVLITGTECVYCAVRTKNLNIIQVNFSDTNAAYSSSSTFCWYQMDKWAKPGNLPKSNALSEIEQHWIGQYLHFSYLKAQGKVNRNLAPRELSVSLTFWHRNYFFNFNTSCI